MISAVCLLRRGETRELAHRPELSAVHVAVNAARVRELSGCAGAAGRQILGAVYGFHRNSADGCERTFGRLHGLPLLLWSHGYLCIKKAGSEEPANYELEAGTVPPEI